MPPYKINHPDCQVWRAPPRVLRVLPAESFAPYKLGKSDESVRGRATFLAAKTLEDKYALYIQKEFVDYSKAKAKAG